MSRLRLTRPERPTGAADERAGAAGAGLASPGVLAAVAAGGIGGAGARWAAGELVPGAGWWPWPILASNVAGCLLLGLLVARPPRRRAVSAAAGAGVCGGLTTWSWVAVQSAVWLDDAQPVRAVTYLAATVATGLGAAAAGVWLGRRRTTTAGPP